MHRLPKIFSKSSKSNHPKPKLSRQNAFKKINYDHSSPSTSASFRVDGNIEILCNSLGFTVDDLSIPVEEYAAAMKARSFSSPVVVNSEIKIVCDENVDDFKVSDLGFCGKETGSGIKGVRPPLIDTDCSTLDMFSVFAPGSVKNGSGFCLDGKESGDMMMGRVTSVLPESYYFSTSSNEDDSSNMTTPMSSFSPSRRFRRGIVDWQKGELLGRGSFGSVYEGIADDGFFFAVKEVSLLDQEEDGKQRILQLEQEIALLSKFQHENIVQYYGTKKDESNLYIFLELVTKGSLMSLYQKYDLRDSQVSAYTRQILHGLKYLHDKNVVHRDIKCANILVDTNGLVKVADFGLAKATKLNDVKSCKGTPFWMAPEVVTNRGYGLPADIWSLGCTVLEMLTRSFPYSNLECVAALFRIGNGIRPPIPDSLSSEARDFILTCLQVDPSLRPTAAQLLDHPFVKCSLSQTSGPASPHYLIRRN